MGPSQVILDTSAIMAILREEPEARQFLGAMRSAESLKMSAGTWLELTAVLTRTADETVADAAELLIERFEVAIESVTRETAAIGKSAYRTYGRGTKHSAKLNFGDCFAYALSKETGEPLLFKGNDFRATDIRRAI